MMCYTKNVMNMKRYLNKLNVISLIIAIYLVVGTATFFSDSSISSILFLIALIIPLFFLVRLLLKYLLKKEIKLEKNPKINKKEIFIYFLVIFFSFLIYYLAFYPGGTSPDVLNQWKQVITNSYNDWHPFIHTLLFFKLPSLITQNITVTVLFQIVFISIILTFTLYLLRKLGFSKKIMFIFIILFMLNPENGRMATMPWKDIPYSYMILTLTVMLMHIVKTNGAWLKENKNLIMLAIFSFLMIMFRHNGILCFIPLFLSIILFYKEKRKLVSVIFIGILVFKFILTGPIYGLIGVGNHSATFSESMGIPNNQIAYIVVNNGYITEEQMKTFNKFGDVDSWKTYFHPTSFNDIKYYAIYNRKFAEENKTEYLKFYLALVKQNTGMAIKSYIYVTSPIWSLKYISQGTYKESFLLDNSLPSKISKALNDNINNYETWLQKLGIANIFFSYGASLFIIMFSLLLITLKSKFYLKKHLPYILVIFNTIAISLLITGGELRFVYCNILCVIPIILYGLTNITKTNENSDNKTLLYTLFVQKTKNSWLQLFRYLFVGGIAAVVNIGSLYIFTSWLNIYYIISNILGFILGLIVNYLLSKAFIFTDCKVNKKKEFFDYTVIGIIGVCIDTLLMFVFTSWIGLFYLISKIISTLLTFIWNFVARKFMYKIYERRIK